MPNVIQRLTRKDLQLRLVSLAKRYVSDLLSGPEAVFRGLCFIPKLPPNLLIKNYQDLVLFLRQFAGKTVDGLVESREQN